MGTESAFEVLARARALEATGKKIIHLEIGEPDFDTPAHIKEAAAEALREGFTHYSPAPGLPELREAVGEFFGRTGRGHYPADRVVITPGAKPIKFYAIMSPCEEGDGMQDRTILLDGCSKTHAMTGWRLGFVGLPPDLVEPYNRMIINSVSCTAAFTQRAALAAVTGPWEPIQAMIDEFHKRRDVIVEGLNRIPGISCTQPAGAFTPSPTSPSWGYRATWWRSPCWT